jgi:hypothetical protein
MSQRYNLVLQWPGSALDDYDPLVSLEDALIEHLPDGSELDGHDLGVGQANIFIDTDSPEAAFRAVQPLLEAHRSGNDLKVRGGARSRRSTNLHGQIPCNLGIYREFDGFVRM